MKNLHVAVYDSKYRLNVSLREALVYYYFGLIKYRGFIWRNFLKHFKASCQQSYFQLFWKIVIPLVPISVYVVMQELGLLKGAAQMPRVIYVVVGMTFWQLFSSSLTSAMAALEKDKALLKKVNLPFFLFYLSSMGDVVFDYILRVILIWFLLLVYDVELSFFSLLLPFYVIPFLLMGMSLGIFLSFFSIFYKDVRNLVDVFLRYGIFASGVIFPIVGSGAFSKILMMNPIFIFIDEFRYMLVFARVEHFKLILLVFFLLIVFSLMVFKKLYSVESRLREFL